ncbi:MAG: hypothetical protein IJW24_01930, partial [Clostridia bacterium]|nr:hypothetical protein [Clostridia bacterium]
ITSQEQFDKLNKNVRFIQFANNCCNEGSFSELDLSSFNNLETVDIGDDSLQNVNRVRITGLEKLHTVRVGSKVFNQDESDAMDKVFEVRNCISLTEVSINRYSFSTFSKLDLEQLPALQAIQFGDTEKESRNFLNAPLDIKNLPNLHSITIGVDSFLHSKSADVKNVTKLSNV